MNLVNHYGYIGLFLGLAMEYFVLVVPGETLLTTVGITTRSGITHFHLLPLVIVTGLGTFTGSMLAYFVGGWLGRPLLEKYGKYLFLTPERLEQSESMFKRFTWGTLLISRYIAVVRDIIPFISGIQKVTLRVYIPLMLVGSFLWTASFIYLGGLLGQLLKVLKSHWKQDLIPAVCVALLLFFVYRLIHNKLKHLGTSKKSEDSPILPQESSEVHL